MFVQNVADLIESVRRFMEAPEYWREAVGARPKYFVHYQEGRKHYFGLSKFCAFKGISLEKYVTRLRETTNGAITQRYIRRLTGQSWKPLERVDRTIRNEFKAWFFRFFPDTYNLDQLFIISLNTILD